MTNLCLKPATELAQLIRDRKISAVELLEAHLSQIEKTNPELNAIVTLVPEMAMESAKEIDSRLAKGDDCGPIAGLPMAHKDLVATKGIRTTFGSRIYADHIPDYDNLIVERMKRAGGVTLGKTNTPEFGAGSQTFNEVFGATRNPYDPSKTCGGSSGGAAVALASGMVPIAEGSDLGGSLRNPASFCNVAGFRPSPGRVPDYPIPMGWSPMGVVGPMGRTVADVALLLTAIAGPDSKCPISINEPADIFSQPLARNFKGTRIAYSADLGEFPVDPSVTKVVETSLSHFEALGCAIETTEPDLSDADFIFKTLRAWAAASKHKELLKTHRHLFKDTLIWNIEEGFKLSGEDISRAEVAKTQLYHRVHEFMDDHEYLIMPVSQVPPFDISTEYVTRINDKEMHTYIDWMKSCYYITVTGLPAISVPCGFTESGLPVGVQIVGRHQQDMAVLQLAHAFEQANPVWQQHPAIAT